MSCIDTFVTNNLSKEFDWHGYMRLRAYIIWAISFGPDLGEIQWFWHFMCGTLWGVGRARSPSQHFSISSIGSPTSIPPSAHANEIRKLISFIWSSISSGSHCIIHHWARSLRRTVHPPSWLFLQCTQFLLNENGWKYLSQFFSYFDQNKNRSYLE